MSLSFMSLRRNPSLQSVRFFLQTRFRCKVAPPSPLSLALRAHRHRLSAFARKKMSALAQGNIERDWAAQRLKSAGAWRETGQGK
jgi:hypothetical protein